MEYKDFHGLTVSSALYELNVFLKYSKQHKRKVVGLITGYGASGKTHKIKTAVLEVLSDLKEKKYLKDFLKGEDVDLFNASFLQFPYRHLLDEDIKRRPNKGAIYVIL